MAWTLSLPGTDAVVRTLSRPAAGTAARTPPRPHPTTAARAPRVPTSGPPEGVTTVESSGEPFVEVGDVRVDARDVEALRAIDEHGSMHAAAAALGRSYARIQSRVVDLEEAAGPLVARQRGGEGGGGSSLTDEARALIERFERLRAEFAGLARAEESVFPGTVVERSGRLGTVETAAGRVRALVPGDAERVRVSVRSDAVVLTAPGDAPPPGETSVRNRFPGSVTGVEREDGLGRVTVDVGADAPLRALVTETSLGELDLGVGDEVVGSFKATATRAVPRSDATNR